LKGEDFWAENSRGEYGYTPNMAGSICLRMIMLLFDISPLLQAGDPHKESAIPEQFALVLLMVRYFKHNRDFENEPGSCHPLGRPMHKSLRNATSIRTYKGLISLRRRTIGAARWSRRGVRVFFPIWNSEAFQEA